MRILAAGAGPDGEVHVVPVIYLGADEDPTAGPFSLVICDPETEGTRFVHHAGSVTHYIRPEDLKVVLPEIVRQATSCGHQAVFVKNIAQPQTRGAG